MGWMVNRLRIQVVNVLVDASVAPGKALEGNLEVAVPTLIGMQHSSMFTSLTHAFKNNFTFVVKEFSCNCL